MSLTDFDSARAAMLSAIQPIPTEAINLGAALGRIVAERIVADADAVPFARSAMDGYAVCAAECSHATVEHPSEFSIVGSVFAEKGERALWPGTALAIMTGAPLPTGADAVIPHERTQRIGERLRIFAPVEVGDCIFPPGEDIRQGDELVACGERLYAGKLALLALAGKARVSVFKRPRVTILCTGRELVNPSETPAHGQVRNSNFTLLSGLVSEASCEPQDSGIAEDTHDALAANLKRASEDTDLLLTTGGASKGERDLVKGALGSLGAEFLFTEVSMRPGRPFGFALWHGLPACVLPGNPAAAFVCFQELVRPALGLLAGSSATELPRVRARLDGVLRGRPNRRYFVLAYLSVMPEGLVVTPLENQCSVLVRTAAYANALAIVPETPAESMSSIGPGDFVEVDVLDWTQVEYRSERTGNGGAVKAQEALHVRPMREPMI
jgi:molybdopterin molybdotransferase